MKQVLLLRLEVWKLYLQFLEMFPLSLFLFLVSEHFPYLLLVSVLVFLVFLHLDSPAVPVSDLVSPAVPASNLILPSSACDTFEEIMKLRQDGEFLFEQNGKRIRGNAFNKHLSRICEKLDIPHRTMHKNLTTYHFSRKRKMPETL